MPDAPMTTALAVIPKPSAPIDEEEFLNSVHCPLYRPSQFDQAGPQTLPWIWHGFVSRRQITLLTGQSKIGKTTLLAALLGQLGAGGTLCGRAVGIGRAVVLSQEGSAIWSKRVLRNKISDAVSLGLAMFRTKPTLVTWTWLIQEIRDLHRKRPIDLLVIDPLSDALPGNQENNNSTIKEAMRPLRDLAAFGPAVLLVHHPAKGKSREGQASRGASALPEIADIQIEMHWVGRASRENRRRQLLTWSRHDEAPRRLCVELSPAGDEYAVIPEETPQDDEVARMIVEIVRRQPGQSAREIRAAWCPTESAPPLRTLSDRLIAMTAFGMLHRYGEGHRYEPYRYGVASEVS